MARKVNLWTNSILDGTTRTNVPDVLVTLRVHWEDAQGKEHDQTIERYLLVQLGWLRANHPKAAKKLAEELALRIELLRQGIIDVGELE